MYYELVWGYSCTQLKFEVEMLIHKGWVPHGSPVIVKTTHNTNYYQAMVKTGVTK